MYYEWPDELILEALHLKEAKGLSIPEIAKAIGKKAKREFTKNQIIGITNRVLRDYEKTDPNRNQNGTMGVLWWQRGVAA